MAAAPTSELLAPKLRDLFFRRGADGRAEYLPSRYKVAYGGRGGAKSWGFARVAVSLGAARKIRVLCARELQNSIQESIHRLLSDQIRNLGLGAYYDIQRQGIYGRRGTEFIFAGIKNDPGKIKSTEGIDICLVEEAEKVSEESWQVLIPTIRKAGSEIWVCFNPREEEDPTYRRFVLETPPQCRRVKIDWRDNPWFPSTLELERQADLARLENANNPTSRARLKAHYEHVWEGDLRRLPTGSFFTEEAMLVDGRPVPFPPFCDGVFATIDTAAKTGKERDGVGVVYWALAFYGQLAYPLVILDWDYRQLDAAFLEGWIPNVFQRLEELARLCNARQGSRGAWIEDKSSGIELLQRCQLKNLPAHAIDPKRTALGKVERMLSISGDVHAGMVKFSAPAYERVVTYKGVTKNHLLSQILAFSPSVKDQGEDDLSDCFSYGVSEGMRGVQRPH